MSFPNFDDNKFEDDFEDNLDEFNAVEN